MEFPMPTEDSVNLAMLDAWRSRGELLLQHCTACSAVTYYPRRRCPSCWACEMINHASTGGGTIVTFSVVHRAVDEVFRQQSRAAILAVVKTDDGPQVITLIVGEDVVKTEIGRRVKLYSGPDRASYPLPVYSLEPAQS